MAILASKSGNPGFGRSADILLYLRRLEAKSRNHYLRYSKAVAKRESSTLEC